MNSIVRKVFHNQIARTKGGLQVSKPGNNVLVLQDQSNLRTSLPVGQNPRSFTALGRAKDLPKSRKTSLTSGISSSFKRNNGQNDKEEDNHQHNNQRQFSSRNSYLVSFIGAFAVLAWNNMKEYKLFQTVEAAKPFYDYETTDRPTDGNKNTTEPPKSPGGGGKIPPRPRRRQLFNFVADVVSEVGHAVVCIDVKDHSTVDWFSGSPRVVSNGSGFIVKEDGLILTNAHVVLGKSQSSLTVRLPDGRCFAGHVEDVDIPSDLATVRINAKGLPVMPLGSSGQTKIGEWVVAIGSPLSLSNTVTCGVVSNVSRSATELGFNHQNISYIQTDASINFGNSGGPLVNLDGEAIGINSMKVTAGISFAIPIDYVKDFLAKCETRKRSGKTKPVRRYIGATLLTLTDEIAAELEILGVPRSARGVLVYKIVVGSPAYLAQLHPGDIIISVNGQETKSVDEVFSILLTADTLKMVVRRGDKTFQRSVSPETVH